MRWRWKKRDARSVLQQAESLVGKRNGLMSRPIVAIFVGTIIALAVIYAVFDERVSFRNTLAKLQVSQSKQPTK